MRYLLLPIFATVAFLSSAFTRIKAKSAAASGMPAYYYDSFSNSCIATYVYDCTVDNLGVFCTYFSFETGLSYTLFEFQTPVFCYQPLYYAF